MRKLEKGKTVPLSPSTNPHFVAGLIKLWLCDLDDPLLTYELHEAFVAAIQPESTKERVELLQEVVGLLPPGCKAVFKEHLRLMADVRRRCGDWEPCSAVLRCLAAYRNVDCKERTSEQDDGAQHCSSVCADDAAAPHSRSGCAVGDE